MQHNYVQKTFSFIQLSVQAQCNMYNTTTQCHVVKFYLLEVRIRVK